MADNYPGTRTLGLALRTSATSQRDAEVLVLAGNGSPSGASVGGKTLATGQAAVYYRQDATSTDGYCYLTIDGGTNWTAVDAGAVDLNLLTAGVVDPAADSFAFIDADDSNASKKEAIDDLLTAIAGAGIQNDTSQIAIDLNDLTATTLDVAADSLAFVDASDSNATAKTTFDDVATQMAGDGINNNVGTLDLDLADLTATTLDVTADSFGFVDASDGNASRQATIDALVTAQAGDGLQNTASQFAVDVSAFAGSGLEDDGSENLRVKARWAARQITSITGGDGAGNVGDLFSTPVTVITAGGADTIILPVMFYVEFIGATAAYDNAGAGNDICFRYNGGAEIVPDIDNGNGGATRFLRVGAGTDRTLVIIGENAEFTPSVNTDIEVFVRTADPYAAAGDVAMRVIAFYRIIDVS